MNTEEEILRPGNWVATYGDYLYSLALIKVNNREAAEDLLQDTFLSAFKARNSFRKDSSEKTWLTAILKNKIIDYYRKKEVLNNLTSYLGDTEAGFNENFFNEKNGHWLNKAAPAEWKELADNKVNRTELNRIIQYCIQKMPSKLISVFVAKYLEEEEAETICKVYNLTASNYWVIIHRAKILIRSCLEKTGFGVN